MSRVNGFLLVLISLFFIQISDLRAQTEADALLLAQPGLGPNVRALGMGNAYMSLSDDATAPYFNPAGLGLMRRMEITAGLDHNIFSNETTFRGNTTTYDNSSTGLSNLSFAFPFPTVRGSLVFGIGYSKNKSFNRAMKFNGFNPSSSMIGYLAGSSNLPFDLYLTDLNDNTTINNNMQQSGTTLESGSSGMWSFSGAMEVEKNFFIGMTLDIISGSYEYNRDYYEDDVNGVYDNLTALTGDSSLVDLTTFYRSDLLNWDVSGWNFKVGFLYQIQNFARVGAAIQFPREYFVNETFAVDGRTDWAGGSTVYLDQEAYTDEVAYDIATPFVFSGGGSVNLFGVIASADVTYTDYSQLEFNDADGLTPQYVASINKDINELLTSTIDLNIGAEYLVPIVNMRVRAGYMMKQSPYRDDPSEFDKKFITGGFGFLIRETLSVDFALALGSWKTVADNYGVDVSRTYQDVSFTKAIFGFSYRF